MITIDKVENRNIICNSCGNTENLNILNVSLSENNEDKYLFM